ncbi:MAG TPA: threonine-phosphate decarboxylase [Phycisphaerales bacterium]|nr:threonine-phosphate decarboxylase [Phycisphaerales bacterium]
MTTGHGGNHCSLAKQAGRSSDEILDFSASINPLGPPDCLRSVISRNLSNLVHYPDPDASELVEAIARRYGLPREQILVGNGSTEILFAAVRALKNGYRRTVIPVPCYCDYARAAALAEMEVQAVKLGDDFALDWPALGTELRGGEMVFLGQPNNPTGLLFDSLEFRRFADAHPSTLFVVDEAFADFVDGYRSLAQGIQPNVVVLRSLTKFYAIPGLRLGFAVARPDLARTIRRHVPPWSVNTLAQAAGAAVLADEEYAEQTRICVAQRRQALVEELGTLPGLHVYPGQANYLLVRLDRFHSDAASLANRLLMNDGIAIRVCENFEGLDRRFFRLAVRTEEENRRLLRALALILKPSPPKAARKTRASSLMIQGTSSNAGKSLLTAALCRILLQDGFRVAPFKSQNMSLNSFVTRDGGEMGRAQVVQAQACRLEPDVRMNPVLLKPNSHTGCQVIVRGRPVGNMTVSEYVRYKPTAFQAAKECYDSLAEEYDAVILEGAGSPGEVNLKSHDIVNMPMARHARAPVLIVGDIDRGGVFASFVGTMEVLAEWERALVAGWVVNRFRGDAGLLAPALEYTRNHTGRPVLGVVPYLNDLNIPQEDSVEFKSGALEDDKPDRDAVEIAVIDLPHISNFTDFDAFRVEDDVRLRVVRSAGELRRPDAVVIPGSKNTLADLAHLRRIGLADRIVQLAADGKTEIVGICAGFQMLGRAVRDPQSVESSAGSVQGLGLLDAQTVMAGEKTLLRTAARHLPSGLEVRGYEIHHGQTEAGSSTPLFARPDGQVVGAAGANGRIWGTYLHGVFDGDAFRRWFIDRLRVRRGLAALGQVTARYDIEPALDRLAEVVQRSLPVERIYRLMGLR